MQSITNMEGTYDSEADVAYIYFKTECERRIVAKTREVKDHSEVYVDFDREGRIIGIEILNASTRMEPSFLEELTKI